jgi:hypothetical protein
MDDKQERAREAYSRGGMAALELRRCLGGAPYGAVLRLLGEARLPLARTAVESREDQNRLASEWMFPKHVARYEATNR